MDLNQSDTSKAVEDSSPTGDWPGISLLALAQVLGDIKAMKVDIQPSCDEQNNSPRCPTD